MDEYPKFVFEVSSFVFFHLICVFVLCVHGMFMGCSKENVPGYVCNPGSPRERDAASRRYGRQFFVIQQSSLCVSVDCVLWVCYYQDRK